MALLTWRRGAGSAIRRARPSSRCRFERGTDDCLSLLGRTGRRYTPGPRRSTRAPRPEPLESRHFAVEADHERVPSEARPRLVRRRLRRGHAGRRSLHRLSRAARDPARQPHARRDLASLPLRRHPAPAARGPDGRAPNQRAVARPDGRGPGRRALHAPPGPSDPHAPAQAGLEGVYAARDRVVAPSRPEHHRRAARPGRREGLDGPRRRPRPAGTRHPDLRAAGHPRRGPGPFHAVDRGRHPRSPHAPGAGRRGAAGARGRGRHVARRVLHRPDRTEAGQPGRRPPQRTDLRRRGGREAAAPSSSCHSRSVC